MQVKTTCATPTFTEIGLADSKDASIDDDIVEQKASAKAIYHNKVGGERQLV